MKLSELEAVIEAALFISSEAVSLNTLAQTIKMDKATTKAIVLSLGKKYEEEGRGIRIVELNGAYEMCTSPQCFEYLRSLYKGPQRQGLTQPLLETLAIVAYRQPVTKAEIEEIRGVSAEHAINKLIEKKLIQEKGRQDGPGKPILFGTTQDFLRYFGFTSLSELPELTEPEINTDEESTV